MANVKTFKITCTNANTAYNVVTGTTAAPTTQAQVGYANVGRQLVFQMQTASHVGTAGGSDVVSLGGIQFSAPASLNGSPYVVGDGSGAAGVNAASWWVSASNAGDVIIVQLIQ